MTNAQRMTADLLNDPFFIGFDEFFNSRKAIKMIYYFNYTRNIKKKF